MKTYVKIALFVVFFLAVGGILAALYLYNLKPQDLHKVTADFIISSSELQKAFEDDEKAASEKYISKVLDVTGEVISIIGSEKNSANVTLQTGSELSKVICTFNSITDLSVFTLGKPVTIRGKCSGFLMDVLLNECIIVTEKE